MYNKSDYWLLIMHNTIESNNQYSDEKVKNLTADLTRITASIMDQIKIPKYSPDKKDSPKAQDPTNMFLANKKASPLEVNIIQKWWHVDSQT